MDGKQLVLNNANVVTMDVDSSRGRSVTIDGARITAIGDAFKKAPRGSHMVDLQGATIIPGLIDTHCHVGFFGGKQGRVSLDGATSLQEICRRIEERVRSASRDEVIVTSPVGDGPYFFHVPEGLVEGRFPSRHDLDSVAPDHAVWITAADNRSPNMAVLNSEALRRIGLMNGDHAGMVDGAAIEDGVMLLDGIEVLLDDRGVPTGQVRGAQELYNSSKYFPIFANLLQYERSDLAGGILSRARERARQGATSILENHGATLEELEVFSSVELPLRVFYAYYVNTMSDLADIEEMFRMLVPCRRPRFGDGKLVLAGVGVDIDGTHSSGTAYSDKPYLGPRGETVEPRPMVEEGKYEAIVRLAAKYGLRVHTCAAGRAASAMALRVFERVFRDYEGANRRWLIEHALFPTAEQIRAASRLRVTVTTATNFVWGQYSEVWEPRLGPAYAEAGIPLKSWLQGGVCVCQTTDWGPQDMMFTLWQSMARRDGSSGMAVSQSECLSVDEALTVLTKNPAYALEMEDLLGSIEPGKLADFTILSEDPSRVAMDDVRSISVLGTMVDGEFATMSDELRAVNPVVVPGPNGADASL